MKNASYSVLNKTVCFLCFVFILAIQEGRSAIFTVTSNADSGPNTLRQAITDANNSSGADEIMIDASVTLINVSIASLGIDDEGLTITGPAGKVTIRATGAFSVFSINNIGAGGDHTFENLIIENGNTGGNGGGIIANGNGTLFVRNCQFMGNSASANGGAIFSQNGDVVVSNSVFENNTAGFGGGAIEGLFMTITSSSFASNQVIASAFGEGGAINIMGDATMTNCTFFDNRVRGSGGAVAGEATIVNCTFYQNIADSDNNGFGSGGALNASGVTLKNSIAFGNTANGVSDDISGSVSSGDANLVGTCSGCAVGVVDYTSDPNLSTAQTCDGLLYFLPQSPSDALDNGIVDGDTPSEDMCGTAWGVGSINLGSAEEVTPLPVTLLDFSAERVREAEVLLAWSTTTEINNAGFEIEESVDGSHFEQIGFVEGAGNSTALEAYSYRVQQPKSRYYRFKQVDFDGTFAYGPVQFVDAGKAIAQQLLIYPNPTQGNLFFENIASESQLVVELLDLQGRQLARISGTQSGVEPRLSQQFRALKKGKYMLRVSTSERTYLRKMIKE